MIRNAKIEDLDRLADMEAASYPREEGAGSESIKERIESFADCFWILEENGNIISFINGMSTDEEDLQDIMYENAAMHNKAGKWQMIFSVVTDKSARCAGNASKLMKQVIKDCKSRGKAGIVLTCKDRLRGFYERFGYKDEGISHSNHGDAIWYQMRLIFSETT